MGLQGRHIHVGRVHAEFAGHLPKLIVRHRLAANSHVVVVAFGRIAHRLAHFLFVGQVLGADVAGEVYGFGFSWGKAVSGGAWGEGMLALCPPWLASGCSSW